MYVCMYVYACMCIFNVLDLGQYSHVYKFVSMYICTYLCMYAYINALTRIIPYIHYGRPSSHLFDRRVSALSGRPVPPPPSPLLPDCGEAARDWDFPAAFLLSLSDECDPLIRNCLRGKRTERMFLYLSWRCFERCWRTSCASISVGRDRCF